MDMGMDTDTQLRLEAIRLAVTTNQSGSDEVQVASADAYYKFLTGETK